MQYHAFQYCNIFFVVHFRITGISFLFFYNFPLVDLNSPLLKILPILRDTAQVTEMNNDINIVLNAVLIIQGKRSSPTGYRTFSVQATHRD